ncbi:MAG: hypothetical protein J6575_03360 [Bifidobacterium sp.]|nr:hypothetical protein [Bifidobacterium sp.]
MSDKWRSGLKIAAQLLMCVVFVGLSVWGQRSTSWSRFGVECVGLVGVVFMLWLYNNTHR